MCQVLLFTSLCPFYTCALIAKELLTADCKHSSVAELLELLHQRFFFFCWVGIALFVLSRLKGIQTQDMQRQAGENKKLMSTLKSEIQNTKIQNPSNKNEK